ncbi:hypothetical protein E3N88_04001 [Mikania micrantha]|uniref:Uncharacterized protein n=1 Tax=Mikania micrantha TaxID=192012 RepID=A0A5N6PU45_9ASTR|nr:hypothetical protein E3N88_04001 [Mikania micrantha]
MISPPFCHEPRDWFYGMPRYRQGFVPIVNSVVKEVEKKILKASPDVPRKINGLQKKFLVLDQSGDQTTLIYHTSIQCAPFEALYGRKCRSPICWSEADTTTHPPAADVNHRRHHPQASVFFKGTFSDLRFSQPRFSDPAFGHHPVNHRRRCKPLSPPPCLRPPAATSAYYVVPVTTDGQIVA